MTTKMQCTVALCTAALFLFTSCLTAQPAPSEQYPPYDASDHPLYYDGDDHMEPHRTYLIPADSDRGYHWPFFITLPEHLKDENRIMVISNNTGFRSDDFEDHVERASGDSRWPYIQLVPVFPRFKVPENVEWLSPQYLSAGTFTTSRTDQYRVDLQLLEMIDRAKEVLGENGITVKYKIFFWGYSGSAFFGSRFVTLHPEMVRAAALGGHYWNPVPVTKFEGLSLPYNYGVDGYTDLTGDGFDADAYRRVKLFIYMGDQDDPIGPIHYGSEMVLDGDGSFYHSFRRRFGTTSAEMFRSFQRIFEESGFTNADFVLYRGGTHGSTNNELSTRDVLQFFSENE